MSLFAVPSVTSHALLVHVLLLLVRLLANRGRMCVCGAAPCWVVGNDGWLVVGRVCVFVCCFTKRSMCVLLSGCRSSSSGLRGIINSRKRSLKYETEWGGGEKGREEKEKANGLRTGSGNRVVVVVVVVKGVDII